MKIMKQISSFIIIIIFNISCTPDNIDDMALDVCKCYKKAKGYNNSARRITEIEYCIQKEERYSYKIYELSKSADWPDSKYEHQRDLYYNAIDECMEK